MIDATPSATPMPVPPVATVTSTEAPSPPAAPPLPVFVPPPVTDPVSNLDFLPVDDAFALELRSETIEQLVGGDALRRGESERIEAGRSHTNADLVAGRDRVRVHATLHEHTGHGLAEQAAHLHTTVDGTLDVHAASEDTVLLAGHMRDLWDGSAAIVAAMTDDTVAGGGIRVTTPLDLWVHGLMGVEERIGTCTADAVLMESSATHYEREYGPGAHAAGLAVYTGSLYQSSRSTFRPLMRVSSGVRNLITGGDGGGGGGSGDGRAGSAQTASPPPVPAQAGAAQASATGTLAAGRRTVEAPATTLDAADALTNARRVPLEALVDSVDARVAEEMGEAGIAMRAEDLPELTRSADTAEQLGALRETLRMDATQSASETAGGFRVSVFEGAVSMHPATDGGGPLEIEPPSAVYAENAPMVRPHPGVAWGQGPEMQLELLGGADRPPQPAAPESDFHVAYRRLRALRRHYKTLSRVDIARDFDRAASRVAARLKYQFKSFGGSTQELAQRPSDTTAADHAYRALQKMARQADNDGDPERAGAIRAYLEIVSEEAVEALQTLLTKHGTAEATPTPAMQLPPAAAKPTAPVAVIPSPAHTPIGFDWITAYKQLCDLRRRCSRAGGDLVRKDFRHAFESIRSAIRPRFERLGGNSAHLLALPGSDTKAEQAYRAIQAMVRRAEESGEAERARELRQALEAIDRKLFETLEELTTRHGATRATRLRPMQRPSVTAGTSVTVTSTTVALAGRLDIPGPAHHIAPEVTLASPQPAGGLVHATDVPSPPAASSLPGPSLAQAGDLGRARLDQPATTSELPTTTEAIVTPSLAGTSSFWLQPFEPVPAQDSVPFDSGLRHTGVAVQPPPVTTTASSTAPALSPGASFPIPARLDEELGVEHALLAGRLPIQAIDVLIEGYRATDEGGSNALYIENLRSLKESIEHAPRDAYPGRVDAQWLDFVEWTLRERGERGELGAPRAASATGVAELEVTEIDRLPGTGEGVPPPAPPPPPSAPERTGAGAGAPPTAADPWRIRPQGMGGEPHPVAFDPWSAPPGPSSRVVFTGAIRTAVMSTGAPPGWQGAGTPGFARAASGAGELPFSQREAIARRFGTEDALLEAELALQTGGAGALGWSATRWRPVLADLQRLHDAIVQSDSAAAAAMIDVDWSAIEALARILEVPPPSP